jgi:hypothetical protein
MVWRGAEGCGEGTKAKPAKGAEEDPRESCTATSPLTSGATRRPEVTRSHGDDPRDPPRHFRNGSLSLARSSLGIRSPVGHFAILGVPPSSRPSPRLLTNTPATAARNPRRKDGCHRGPGIFLHLETRW